MLTLIVGVIALAFLAGMAVAWSLGGLAFWTTPKVWNPGEASHHLTFYILEISRKGWLYRVNRFRMRLPYSRAGDAAKAGQNNPGDTEQ